VVQVTVNNTHIRFRLPILPVAARSKRPLASWDCGFESSLGLGSLSLVSVVCYQVEVVSVVCYQVEVVSVVCYQVEIVSVVCYQVEVVSVVCYKVEVVSVVCYQVEVVSVVCYQVEVTASGSSLVQKSLTECGVSECHRESSTMRRPWAQWGLLCHGRK
jgi:hypothetical protein